MIYKRTPDLIIVDYLDIMEPNQRVSADNVFEKDKRVSEQIRDIGNDYRAVIASASQQNRGAVDQTHINQSHVAGGLSKVNTADIWISILANKAQRAANECAFQFLKTRSSEGEGEVVYMQWTKNIRIKDHLNSQKGLVLNTKDKWLDTEKEDVGPKKDLIDLFDT